MAWTRAWRDQGDALRRTNDTGWDCTDRSHVRDAIDARSGHREEVQSGRERRRDQDWPDDVLQRTQLTVRGGGPNLRRLLPKGKRRGRYWRTQDQVHLVRRCVQTSQDRGAGTQAYRKR